MVRMMKQKVIENQRKEVEPQPVVRERVVTYQLLTTIRAKRVIKLAMRSFMFIKTKLSGRAGSFMQRMSLFAILPPTNRSPTTPQTQQMIKMTRRRFRKGMKEALNVSPIKRSCLISLVTLIRRYKRNMMIIIKARTWTRALQSPWTKFTKRYHIMIWKTISSRQQNFVLQQFLKPKMIVMVIHSSKQIREMMY